MAERTLARLTRTPLGGVGEFARTSLEASEESP
jgi:hypothetical protein